MESVHAVELKGISKRFGMKVANDSVDLYIDRGVIMALLGENGSGKTTLMNMLAGIYAPDEGKIFIDGKEVTISSPKVAYDYHIGMVHQHFKLVDVFTATENIVLGLEEKGRLDLKAASAKIRAISDRYGFDIDPDKKIYEMSVSEKQTVEIIKVLYRGADILILDEPTAVLTPQEIEKLFRVIKAMKDDGKVIIIITHKLNEVMAVSDVVAVLRKGKHIKTVVTAQTNPQELTDLMVGHKVELNIDRKMPVDPQPRITVAGLSVRDSEGVKKLDNVGFIAFGGEILGVAGIAGSGLACRQEGPRSRFTKGQPSGVHSSGSSAVSRPIRVMPSTERPQRYGSAQRPSGSRTGFPCPARRIYPSGFLWVRIGFQGQDS